MRFVIHPELMALLETIDVLDVLKDSVSYQMQKIQGVEKTTEGRDWYQELPLIVREKFDNYKTDYEHLSGILQQEKEQIKTEMNKGYYYWRLLHSACNTYRNDLVEYDQQLNQEFNFKETEAISDNEILNECIVVLAQHVVED
jgi:hypothetical protein